MFSDKKEIEEKQQIYSKYSSNSSIIGETNFFCFKDYVLELLELSDKNYISFERFKSWFRKEKMDRIYSFLKVSLLKFDLL